MEAFEPWMVEALILLGASAAFAILHLAFFAFYREERSSLYLAIATIGFVLFQAAEIVAALAEDRLGPWRVSLLGPLINSAGITVGLGTLRFAYAFFDFEPRRAFRVLLAVAVVLIAGLWLGHRTEMAPPASVMVLALGTVADIVRTVIRAFRAERPGARTVGVGFLALGTAGGLQALGNLGMSPFGRGLYFTYGVLALLVILSLSLARRFADTTRTLELQTRRMRELDRSRRLQRSLLPERMVAPSGWRIEASMTPATEVGGDYYDYREDGHAVMVAVGDATGHGMDAGLIVAATKALFQSLPSDAAPAEAVAAIARGIRGLGLRRMNMALALARLELDGEGGTGRIALSGGGMPPPLLRRAATGAVDEIRIDAPPLGAMRLPSRSPHPQRTVFLGPGDVLLLYTDGLPECADPEDRSYGYERLRERFAAFTGEDDDDLAGVLRKLFESAREWAAGRAQDDDLTLVAIRRTG